jgi:hypothetical protein
MVVVVVVVVVRYYCSLLPWLSQGNTFDYMCNRVRRNRCGEYALEVVKQCGHWCGSGVDDPKRCVAPRVMVYGAQVKRCAFDANTGLYHATKTILPPPPPPPPQP